MIKDSIQYKKKLKDYKTYFLLKVFGHWLLLSKVFFYILYRIYMKKMIKKKPAIKEPVAKRSSLVKVVDKPKKKSWLRVLAIANSIGFVAVIIVNYLATSLPIWWMSTGELSDLYPNLFTPTGLTFSIRGLIYMFLLWFVIRQIVDVYKKKGVEITKKIWIWFLLSCITNIWWIFAWHYKLVWLSVLIMIVFLLVLIVINNKVEIWKKIWNQWDKTLVQIPFSLYLGWISVATIANISTYLVHIWWGAWWMSDIFWTILVIIVATLLALLSLYKKNNIIYALVIVWAFVGIIIKRVAVDPIYASSIIWTLGVCIAIVAAWIWSRREKRLKN
mgnify:CR=1 FL=1